MALDAIIPIIEAQAVGGDFWVTNASEIDFNMGSSSQVDSNSSFCVPAGVPFEFFTTIAAQQEANAAVTGLQLVNIDGNTIVASQDVNEMVMSINTTRDRDMSLTYKGVGSGENLAIHYTSLQGNTQMAFS